MCKCCWAGGSQMCKSGWATNMRGASQPGGCVQAEAHAGWKARRRHHDASLQCQGDSAAQHTSPANLAAHLSGSGRWRLASPAAAALAGALPLPHHRWRWRRGLLPPPCWSCSGTAGWKYAGRPAQACRLIATMTSCGATPSHTGGGCAAYRRETPGANDLLTQPGRPPPAQPHGPIGIRPQPPQTSCCCAGASAAGRWPTARGCRGEWRAALSWWMGVVVS